MTSQVDIISNAAVRCGDDPISSLESDRTAVTIGVNLYPTELKAMLSDALWQFARKTVQLSRLVDTPVANWQYAYQEPTDKVKNLGLSPRNLSWQSHGDKILTNFPGPLYMDYIYQAPESKFPALFTKCMELQMAIVMAMPLAGSETLKQSLMVELYGAPGEQGVYSLAKATHAQEEPNQQPISSPFTEARF